MLTSPYVLLNGAGFIAGLFILDSALERYLPARRDFVYVLLVLAVPFGWMGARVLDWALTQSPFMSGGFVFYGGLIAGAAMSLMVGAIRLTRSELFIAVNVVALPIVIAHGIGRVGCFLSGCCYGDVCSLFGARHPTQLYEACFLLALAVGISFLKGECFCARAPIYLTAYPTFRFFNEFLRGDVRGELFGLSTSQWVSVPLCVIGLCMFAHPDVRRCLPTSRFYKTRKTGEVELHPPGAFSSSQPTTTA